MVFTAIAISEGSALGCFEQHNTKVSSGMDLTLWTGRPKRDSMFVTGSPLLSISNHFRRRSWDVLVTQHVHSRPSFCARSVMSTKT